MRVGAVLPHVGPGCDQGQAVLQAGGAVGWTVPAILAAIGIPAAALAATAWPLLTYSLGLALFGLAHVLSELRYVDLRFGPRLGQRLRRVLGVLLTAVVALRLCGIAGWLPAAVTIPAELAVVAGLAAAVLPLAGFRPLAALTAAGLGAAAALWPFQALAVLAVAHNLTPLGFLAEALRGRQRRVALAIGSALFIGGPLIIASGLLQARLAAWGLLAPEATLLDAGPLAAQLGVYLPRPLDGESWAVQAFSAAVFAQLLHYAAVIHVLPRLLPDSAACRRGAGVLGWPPAGRFRWIVIGVGVVAAAGFAVDFTEARAVYGLAAAVHAWVEVPLLLLAVPAVARAAVSRP